MDAATSFIKAVVFVGVVGLGSIVLLSRALRRRHLPGNSDFHWTESMSGGRWSAAALAGICVAVVAMTQRSWWAIIAGLALAVPTTYATIAQVRRRRF